MTRFLLIALVLAACGGRAAAPSQVGNHAGGGAAAPTDDGKTLPAEVTAFLDRWEECQHWAGEEAYDAARAAEIEAGVDLSCPGNDETRADLERRYASDPAVMAKLRALDE